jgi:hypothetical protein
LLPQRPIHFGGHQQFVYGGRFTNTNTNTNTNANTDADTNTDTNADTDADTDTDTNTDTLNSFRFDYCDCG